MPKDNSQTSQNLLPVYISMGLLGIWIAHLAQQHHRMARAVSQKNLCALNAVCQAEANAANSAPLVTRSTANGTMQTAPPLHDNFVQCFNYQNAAGNPNDVASFIHNEISARGNLPLAVQNNKCVGGGCPHPANQCYNFWLRYAQALAR